MAMSVSNFYGKEVKGKVQCKKINISQLEKNTIIMDSPLMQPALISFVSMQDTHTAAPTYYRFIHLGLGYARFLAIKADQITIRGETLLRGKFVMLCNYTRKTNIFLATL